MQPYGDSYDGDGHGVPKSDEGTFASAVDGAFDHVLQDANKVVVPSINDEFIRTESGTKTYSNKAYFAGQSAAQGSFKLSPPVVEVFHLGSADELKAYNDILARSASMTGGDPQIHILQHERQFWQGEFVIYLMYSKYWYLLPGQS